MLKFTPLDSYHLCRKVHHRQCGSSHRSIHCTAPHTSLHCCSASCSCCNGPGSLDSSPVSLLPSPSGQRSHHLSSEPACSRGSPSDHLRHLRNKKGSIALVEAGKVYRCFIHNVCIISYMCMVESLLLLRFFGICITQKTPTNCKTICHKRSIPSSKCLIRTRQCFCNRPGSCSSGGIKFGLTQKVSST